MKVCGYAANEPKSVLTQLSFDRREPHDHDVVIGIHYCGICHSDIHQVNSEWGGNGIYPMVLGHEITGIVSEVGTK